MIKTLTLGGLTSVTVKESPFDMARFCWVRNRTESDVYISCTDTQCTPNADGVKCISAGECGMLDSESRETLYISGSGVVNIETTPFLVCPFNRGGKGGVSYELPIATTEILGGVMPDGTTITVDENGVISGSKASAGSSTRPVYFSNGKPVACSYTLGKSVPSNAVFTDTVYTLPIATTSALGGVIPDGTSITIDENGVISAVGSGETNYIIQYGVAKPSSGVLDVTFPKTFATTPTVVVSAATNSNGTETIAYLRIVSESGFTAYERVYSGGSFANSGYDLYWIAIGEV